MTESFNQTVLVDMDGVIFDFDGEVRRQMNIRYHHIQPVQLDPPEFHTAKNYPSEHQNTVRAIYNEPGFIAGLPLTPNALLGFERLLEAGYNARICSALLSRRSAPHCREEKIAALEEHFVPKFGHWVIDTALFTSDKYLVDGSALIDDKTPPIRNSDKAVWEQIVFDHNYNRTISSAGYLRLLGWADPNLPDILQEANERHIHKISHAH